eukprot:CAMPEP_0203967344 /NCGR_PEP_ID=MMETSP0359-20131031/96360_1 /ASSEMBLY_ACC=CAM_ASM_000338 /TAXON_ID=268821 /ORGANISM="Scrippsiella Hangoei, Strain SHTV-5" /LENGTH=43 /DNA_ID= /DNA_START= /DNA_END= /DNA_ORIENTATION=
MRRPQHVIPDNPGVTHFVLGSATAKPFVVGNSGGLIEPDLRLA